MSANPHSDLLSDALDQDASECLQKRSIMINNALQQVEDMIAKHGESCFPSCTETFKKVVEDMKEKLPYDFKQHHAAQGDVAMLTVQSRVDTLLIDLILNYNEGIPGRQAMIDNMTALREFITESIEHSHFEVARDFTMESILFGEDDPSKLL